MPPILFSSLFLVVLMTIFLLPSSIMFFFTFIHYSNFPHFSLSFLSSLVIHSLSLFFNEIDKISQTKFIPIYNKQTSPNSPSFRFLVFNFQLYYSSFFTFTPSSSFFYSLVFPLPYTLLALYQHSSLAILR